MDFDENRFEDDGGPAQALNTDRPKDNSTVGTKTELRLEGSGTATVSDESSIELRDNNLLHEEPTVDNQAAVAEIKDKLADAFNDGVRRSAERESTTNFSEQINPDVAPVQSEAPKAADVAGWHELVKEDEAQKDLELRNEVAAKAALENARAQSQTAELTEGDRKKLERYNDQKAKAENMNKGFKESKGWRKAKAIGWGFGWLVTMFGLGAAWLTVKAAGISIQKGMGGGKS